MNDRISVVVVTYNQKNKVLQCLDSLLSSRTSGVELVVSDDCSRDGTQETVRQWLSQHGNAFADTIFLQNATNQGTVANVGRAIAASGGQYIKLIAGDDWFCDGALDYLAAFAATNVFDAAFCPVIRAHEDPSGKITVTASRREASKQADFFGMSSREQFDALARNDLLPAPGSFFTRSFWETIRLGDYPFKFEEDWPMWLLGALNSVRFVEIDEPLVIYRHHETSVFQNTASPVFRQVMRDIAQMYARIVFPNKRLLSWATRIRARLNFIVFSTLGFLPLQMVHSLFSFRKKLRK